MNQSSVFIYKEWGWPHHLTHVIWSVLGEEMGMWEGAGNLPDVRVRSDPPHEFYECFEQLFRLSSTSFLLLACMSQSHKR